jgi:NADH-quinone oxidoreductase subunit E
LAYEKTGFRPLFRELFLKPTDYWEKLLLLPHTQNRMNVFSFSDYARVFSGYILAKAFVWKELFMDITDFSVVDRAIAELGAEPESIIGVLQAAQEHYRYLPKELFSYMAKKLSVGVSRIYSVATFYENFSFEPKGKFLIKVCDGTACHVRKSTPTLERLRKELGLATKQKSTEDLLFTVETVSCLGACGLAPVLTVNDKVYPSMTPDKAAGLLEALKSIESKSTNSKEAVHVT